MIRFVFWFGLAGGLLITALKWGEYRFLVIDHSVAIYATLVAVVFAALGIWLGRKLTPKPEPTTTTPPAVPDGRGLSLGLNQGSSAQGLTQNSTQGLTPREIEILHLVAQGLSNREIAEKLFVSENTVKTHCRRTFEKLGAKRRTQAVQLGKEFGVIP